MVSTRLRKWISPLGAIAVLGLWSGALAHGQIAAQLAPRQSEYRLRAGESAVVPVVGLKAVVAVSASPEPKYPIRAFLRSDGASIRVVVPPTTPNGSYAVAVTATDWAGLRRDVAFRLDVAAPQLEPLAAPGTVPVVLLNGFQLVCTNTDSTVAGATSTFGQSLGTDLWGMGLSVAFFNNCSYGDISIEELGNELRTFLGSLTYSDGTAVTQFDLVTHSMGGLIARAYLAGLQPDGTLTPPPNPRIRKLVLIASPNFGSFVAGDIGVQESEMSLGSAFLWDLATWNQGGDDMRGVDALAIAGNAGYWSTPSYPNASDGVVSLTSASLGFARSDSARTRILPYCHIDPNADLGLVTLVMDCSAPTGLGVATADDTHVVIESFLSGGPEWMSIGDTPATNQYLSQYGGAYFRVVDANGQWLSDVSAVTFNGSSLSNGTALGVFDDEYIRGSGTFLANSSSRGQISYGQVAIPNGHYAVFRAKFMPAIFNVTPLLANTPGRVVQSGATITINGVGFGQQQCGAGCQVLAAGSPLQVLSWSDTAISAYLPTMYTGLVTLQVQLAAGTDAINIMASPGVTIGAGPSALRFSYNTGGTAPASQTVQITDTGAGSISWTATANASWVSLSASSGVAPEAISISVNPAGLSVGSYMASIEISAPGTGASPATVSVALIVQAPATPSVQLTSVTNGASFQPGVASAMWVSVFGSNLAPSVRAWNAGDFVNGQLPMSLDGVSVTIDGLAAYVAYISPGQINVLAPDDPVTGPVPVQVTTPQGVSNVLIVEKQPVAPAFFMLGGNYAAAEHADGTYVGRPGLVPGAVARPAQPGETIVLFGTGFGPTNPLLPTNQLVTAPAPLVNKVRVTIGGIAADVVYSGLVESGLCQVNVKVPNVPTGDAAVSAIVAGETTQVVVSITVQN